MTDGSEQETNTSFAGSTGARHAKAECTIKFYYIAEYPLRIAPKIVLLRL